MSFEISLKPFSYQIKLRDHFKQKPKLWDWFHDDKNRETQFEEWKKNLLKDSYRLTPESHPELYATLNEIKEKMEIPIPVILYQEQLSYQNNVGIMFQQDEAHIIISGNILKVLDHDELKAVLCHELYHYYLFEIEQKDYEITDRIITSISNDERSTDIYLTSGKLFKLYTELYCDRGAYNVMQSVDPVISSLVKLNTGIDKVNVASYLTQADEILKSEEETKKSSHPETFIRAKALELWSKKTEGYEETIDKFIQPKIEYEKLNIFSQEELQKLTSQLIKIILKPNWNKSDRANNLAKSYFPNLNFAENVDTEEVFDSILLVGDSTKKYLSYILLDFALVDPDQGNIPLGYALEIAEQAGMVNTFKTVIKKEIKLTERKFRDLKEDALTSLNNVNESKEDSLYGE